MRNLRTATREEKQHVWEELVRRAQWCLTNFNHEGALDLLWTALNVVHHNPQHQRRLSSRWFLGIQRPNILEWTFGCIAVTQRELLRATERMAKALTTPPY